MKPEQIIIQGLLTSYSFLPGTRATPSLIFLHGWGSTKEVWGRARQLLQTVGLSSYALDLPGFGKTETPPTAWGISNYAAFVTEFLNKLNLKQTAIIGHSFGGRIALIVAATNEQSVEKMILVDSAGIYTAAWFKKILTLFSKAVKPFFRLRWTQPIRKKIYRAIGAADYVATPALTKIFVKIIRQDLTDYLRKISQPTLIVWGKDDSLTPLSYAKKFAGGIKNSQLVVLEKAGHYSFLDQPEAFLDALKKFLL